MPRPLTECIVVAQRGLGQDRAAAKSRAGGTTVVLADGSGGRAGGRQAAELCIARAAERMRLADDADPLAIIAELDQMLLADRDAGETTLVLARLVGNELRGASVGDSGAWLVGDSDYRDLTERQIRKPMLGSGAAQGTAFAASVGAETLLIASDGLFDYASPSTICEIVRSAPDLATAGDTLIASVRLRSGALQDDTSLILLRFPT